jgi:hypothetical protein
MRTTILAILLLVSSTTVDAKLKIETRVDRLTKQTITQADGLKVCQPRDSGAFAKCATVKLAWIATQADSVAIRLEFPETVSIQEVAINVDGVVQAFKATTASTDFGFDPNLARVGMSGASSANTFLISIAALRALSKDASSGILRVSGPHSSIDFDFWRQAKMKGLPVDDLRQFLDAVAPMAAAQ